MMTLIYDKPANYTQDMKATVAKPSPRGDGHDVIEVELHDKNGADFGTAENPVVVSDAAVIAAAEAILAKLQEGVGVSGSLTELTTLQNAATANGNGTVFDVAGKPTAIVQVSGTFSAFVVLEGTIDGTTWVQVPSTQIGANSNVLDVISAPGIYRVSCAGLYQIRARIASYTSGSVTVKARATMAEASNNNIIKSWMFRTDPILDWVSGALRDTTVILTDVAVDVSNKSIVALKIRNSLDAAVKINLLDGISPTATGWAAGIDGTTYEYTISASDPFTRFVTENDWPILGKIPYIRLRIQPLTIPTTGYLSIDVLSKR